MEEHGPLLFVAGIDVHGTLVGLDSAASHADTLFTIFSFYHTRIFTTPHVVKRFSQ